MKTGFETHLAVEIPNLNVDDVEKIEFIFKRSKTSSAKLIKCSTYPTTVIYDNECYLIPWTREETYLVEPGSKFYMDTRVKLKGTDDLPETNIIELIMHPSLFNEGVESC